MTRKKEHNGAIDKQASNPNAGNSGPATKAISKAKERVNDVATRLEKYARTPGKEVLQVPEQCLSQPTKPLFCHQKKQIESTGTMEVELHSADDNAGLPGLSDRQITDPSLSLPSNTPTLLDIYTAVQTCNASLNSVADQLMAIRTDILLIRQDLQKVREKVAALEERVSHIEDEMAKDKVKINSLLQHANDSRIQIEDLENRLRRNNIRVVGLPERVEGQIPVEFAERWLQELVGEESLSQRFSVERAHRVPMRPPVAGGPPRSFLIKLLNYRDRDSVLRRAREIGDLQFNGARIMLFPDFSRAVQQQRAKFQDVEHRLCQLKMKYAMLYPAKLRVVSNDSTVFF